MKRENEVPAQLLKWLEMRNSNEIEKGTFDNLNLFCTMPVRAVKMKILENNDREKFHTVIIPSIDIYITKKAFLKTGYFKKDALYFFISGTHMPFPYGHVYAHSGSICLGSIFVPSAVPERSLAMPLETLFLHNDRNLDHGGASLFIDKSQAKRIGVILEERHIRSGQKYVIVNKPSENIIANDEIWRLSADVAVQKPLPQALSIMADIYNIIFEAKTMEEEEDGNG